jgi:glycosyltransferase involved in cell wall biosynthesis
MRASVPSPSLDLRPELSLVFPAFDEAQNLGPLLERALEIGHGLARRFEIIVVDDGSRDGSADLVAARAAEYDQIRLIRHSDNRGYGAALRAGLREARGDLVFFSDADLQFDLAELAVLVEHAQDFDVVAGYRAPRRDPWGRRLLAACWGALVRSLFGLPVRDIDCAFKIFRRPVLQALPISSLSAFVNTEILVRARSAGFRIHQVPVSHHPRVHGRQSGANPRVIARALRELVLLYAELRRPRLDPGLLRGADSP